MITMKTMKAEDIEQVVLENLGDINIPANQIIDKLVESVEPSDLVSMLALHYPEYLAYLSRQLGGK